MALGSTQPLTEMSTRSISWGKGGRCVRLTTYHHPVPLSRNLGALTSWNPLGLSRLVTRLLYLYYIYKILCGKQNKRVPECTGMSNLSDGRNVKLSRTSDQGTEIELYILNLDTRWRRVHFTLQTLYIYIYIYLFIYLLQLGCYPVAVVILHVNKI